MKIGEALKDFENEFVPAAELLGIIKKKMDFEALPIKTGATAYNYKTEQGIFGTIASETKPFCSHCSRIRLSAEGRLYGCLFKDASVDLRPFQGRPEFEFHVLEAMQEAIGEKPTGRLESTAQMMHAIGG